MGLIISFGSEKFSDLLDCITPSIKASELVLMALSNFEYYQNSTNSTLFDLINSNLINEFRKMEVSLGS